MDTRKVLLVDLGGISEPTKIFATLLIAKIRQAAFQRAHIHESKRIPFNLYVDEFEFFQTSDFDQILSFAGGYGLRLTLANQFIGQLDNVIRQSIFGNVGSFIVFAVSPDDARYFKHISTTTQWTEEHWGDATATTDLSNLPKFRALYKIAGHPPVVMNTPAPPYNPPKTNNAEYVRKRTLEHYASKSAPVPHTPKDETEKPEPEATLPHDMGKAPSAQHPQRVFRSDDKGTRLSTKKPDSN
jgi:hypothetical protein